MQQKGLKGLTPILRSLIMGKMLSGSIRCFREIIPEGKNQCSKGNCFLILRNCHSHLTFSNHHHDQSEAIKEVRPSTEKKIMAH